TFAQALRQLCEHYQLRPSEYPRGRYVLYNAPMAAPPPANEKPPGAVEKDGIRFFVREVDVQEGRSIAFEAGQGGWDGASASVQVGCRLLTGDAERIASIENASAKDDLGNLLIANGNDYYSSGSGPYPDEW